MEFEIWIYYALGVLLLSSTPGPSILLCVTKSVTQGFNSAIYSAYGSLLAFIILMTLSFVGLGIIIASSDFAFTLIKYIGAIYLIYLGYKAYTSKVESYEFDRDNISKKDKLTSFMSGFMIGISNPKVIIFFMALFPQFINIETSLLTQYLIFVITFIVIELMFSLTYAYFGNRFSGWFLEKGRAKFFNKITGGIFMGAGILLSTANRN